jgi:molecular chaperone DnaK (HSP70)
MAIERILGIDLGTSTTLIKVKSYDGGKPVGAAELSDYVRFDGTNDIVPTIICYAYEEYLYGHQAAANSGMGELLRNFKLD